MSLQQIAHLHHQYQRSAEHLYKQTVSQAMTVILNLDNYWYFCYCNSHSESARFIIIRDIYFKWNCCTWLVINSGARGYYCSPTCIADYAAHSGHNVIAGVDGVSYALAGIFYTCKAVILYEMHACTVWQQGTKCISGLSMYNHAAYSYI